MLMHRSTASFFGIWMAIIIPGDAAGEIGNWSLLGVKGLRCEYHAMCAFLFVAARNPRNIVSTWHSSTFPRGVISAARRYEVITARRTLVHNSTYNITGKHTTYKLAKYITYRQTYVYASFFLVHNRVILFIWVWFLKARLGYSRISEILHLDLWSSKFK